MFCGISKIKAWKLYLKPSVNKLLDNLMDMKIIELVEDKKRYRQYVYKKYVDILSEGTML